MTGTGDLRGHLYGPQTLPLPRGDDNAPPPNHQSKRSSAPWNPSPDRGPLVLRVELGDRQVRRQL